MTHKLDQMTVLRASIPLQLKLAGPGAAAGQLEGYASTFGGEPDSYGDIIAPGAFAKSLSAHNAAGTMPVMLWAHDMKAPIGRWLEMKEDARGLFVRGQLNLQTDRGKEAHEHLKAGDVGGFSIGYRVPDGGSTYNRDGTTTLNEVDLAEVSVVSIPANRNARVTEVKTDGPTVLRSQAELEELLRKAGLPRGAAVKLAAGGFPALFAEPQPDQPPEIERFLARIKAATRELTKD